MGEQPRDLDKPIQRLGKGIYLRLQRRVWLIFGLIQLILLALAIALAVYSKNAIEWDVMQSTSKEVQLLGHKVVDVLDTIDAVLKLVAAQVRPEDFSEAVTPERRDQLFELLRKHRAEFKQINNLGLSSPAGVVIYYSQGQGANIEDRDYYLYLRDHPEVDKTLSGFIRLRDGSNVPGIVLARRIPLEAGHFGGLVIANIRLAFFEDLIDKLELGKQGVSALYTPELVMLGRRPAAPDFIGKPLPEREHILGLIGNKERASFKLRSPVDGIQRIYSSYRIPGYGLLAVVGYSAAEYLAPWYQQVFYLEMAYMVLSLIILGILRIWLDARYQEIHQIETALSEGERNREFRDLVASLGHPLLVIDKKSRQVLHANEETSRSLGMEAADLIGRAVDALFDPETNVDLERLIQTQQLEARLHRPDGSRFWGLLTVTASKFSGQETLTLGILNIDERKAREDELTFKAHYDPLTSVYSRGYFTERLAAAFAHARCQGRLLAAIAFDLDRFKVVNDTYGHAAGDVVLKGAVAAARSVLREADLLGRVGGEEFIVVTTVADHNAALQIAERIRCAIYTQAIPIDQDKTLRVTASFGVAVLRHDHETLDAWLARADAALYDAKTSGRNRVCTR